MIEILLNIKQNKIYLIERLEKKREKNTNKMLALLKTDIYK